MKFFQLCLSAQLAPLSLALLLTQYEPLLHYAKDMSRISVSSMASRCDFIVIATHPSVVSLQQHYVIHANISTVRWDQVKRTTPCINPKIRYSTTMRSAKCHVAGLLDDSRLGRDLV